ncbi:hypothetical protein GEV43_24570 [Actinomadura sp. J1-007]|uniref:hypothetical protein n=1 Tax=Actinomadura sp. J1-007 TaxID=2661913 RepID=UPI001329558B|nr:hypothetical protein [Actinomadura sp. J1-007]MWK36925.1 hypothetical protein [Actinomadura sp. J1-007]
MATPSRPALTTLSVRYNPPVAWGALALGVLNLLLGLLAPGPLINVILGVLFIVLGVIFFVRTYFTYSAAGRTLEVTARSAPAARSGRAAATRSWSRAVASSWYGRTAGARSSRSPGGCRAGGNGTPSWRRSARDEACQAYEAHGVGRTGG